MAQIEVGQVAPSFRLPSGQGPEVALEDYRGKKNVIVWFTKGMACMFCRAQMSQLSRAYGDLQKLDAEILEVSSSGVSRAQVYAKKFKLPAGRGYWQIQGDLFNTLNAHPMLAVTTNYGSALGNATQALQLRILTIGAQLHF